MKLQSIIMIIMSIAFLLGLGLGGLAVESQALAGDSATLPQDSSHGRSGKVVTNTHLETKIITVDPCAASYATSSRTSKVALRAQQVLSQLPPSTLTIRRTSTLRSTVTASFVASSSLKIRSTRTRTTYATLTMTTTVSAAPAIASVPSSHAVFHPPTSKIDTDNFDAFDYEYIDEKSKIELRDLAVSSAAPPTACPTDISGDYQFPHLIIPTSIGMPDQPQGTQYTVWISPAASTLFNFDIPSTYTGTCSLVFLFPYMSQLDPSAGKYTYSGQEQVIYQNGGLNFALLAGVADNSTTYNTTPPIAVDYGKTKILPGNKYTVAVFPCPAGKTITIEGSSANKTELDYFQNTGKEPIGLFLVPCI